MIVCRSPAAGRLFVVTVLGLLAACAGDRDPPPSDPVFYRSMASASAALDAPTAASMISGYRANNGLTAVTVDPELMKLAQAQARAMAARDKLDHNVIRDFTGRLQASGYDAKFAAVYAPQSKYKVFWALILAAPDQKRG